MPNDSASSKRLEKGRKLLASGAAIFGNLLALSYPAGDPFTATVIGGSIQFALEEFGGRLLAKREGERVGGTLAFALQRIEQLMAAGYEPRTDGFFDENESGRSNAQELIEGVLTTAQREQEEKKIKHMSYLMAEVCFASDVDAISAGRAIRVASELSWNQYVILAVVQDPDRSLPSIELGDDARSWKTWAIHSDIADLSDRHNLLARAMDKTSSRGLPYPSNNAGSMALRHGGLLLSSLLKLDVIEKRELDTVIHAISVPNELVVKILSGMFIQWETPNFYLLPGKCEAQHNKLGFGERGTDRPSARACVIRPQGSQWFRFVKFN